MGNVADSVHIRRMQSTDVELGMRLKEEAGWNQTAADWHHFLRFRPHGCFVAEVGGVGVGTTTTVVHSGSVGWVGMVLVDRSVRRQGIGRRLLGRALESLDSECHTVGLDATTEGQRLYQTLGFHDHVRLGRWVATVSSECQERSAHLAGSITVRSFDLNADAPAAFELDRHAFGAPRVDVIEAWARQSPQLSFVVDASVNSCAECVSVTGYASARPGSLYAHVGPIVATGPAIAEALLANVLQRLDVGTAVAIDALEAGERAQQWTARLQELGFVRRREFVRMFRGIKSAPSHPEWQWASAGPAVG